MMAHASTFTSSWALRPARATARRPSGALMEAKRVDTERWNAAIRAVAATRDRVAFQNLFDHFGPRVKGYLMRLGAGAAVAEDLAQEAMLLVWRKADLFDPSKASASTWIFTIARNLRIDAIRKERRPELDPSDPSLHPEEERAADDAMDMAKAETRLRAALAELPAEQLRIIELSFLAEKPHSLIANELGLPLGTVKSRIRLAMARLRVALGESP